MNQDQRTLTDHLLGRMWMEWNQTAKIERFGQYVLNRINVANDHEIFYEEDPEVAYNLLSMKTNWNIMNEPAKLQFIVDQLIAELGEHKFPVLNISAGDNLCSSITINGSLDPKETWTNGIWQNSRHFQLICYVFAKRYYEEGDNLQVSYSFGHGVKKFRAVNNVSPETLIKRIVKYLRTLEQEIEG